MRILLSISMLLGLSLNAWSQTDKVVELQNAQVSLEIQVFGGAISSFSLKKNPVNPLSWALTSEQMPPNNQPGAPFRGHFLCVGRWGSPTAGEKAVGIPHNGDHNNRHWLVHQPNPQVVHMQVAAPGDQVFIERDIQLASEHAIFRVVERVHHTGTVGHLSNVVQHPTLGPPFLSPQTRINSNSGAGFLQKMSYPNPDAYAYRWPNGIRDSARTPLDLRRTDEPYNYVTTHVFDANTEQGWITAYSPDHQLVYGFVWETADYPWLNLWHYMVDGKPFAKGLEFGTAGIGRPYQELIAEDCRFEGHLSYFFHDAGEVVEKRYTCFLIPVEKGFEEVKSVSLTDGELLITGANGAEMRFGVE